MIMNYKYKQRKNPTRSVSGFTLVELMVVLVILGILAAILMPSMLGFINRHKEQQVITECRTVVLTAQSMYAEAYELGKIPPSASDILSSSGLTEGTITKIELNSGTIKDSGDILLHLTYQDKGITVTYCRDYLTLNDGHDDLYTLSDGKEGNGSWNLRPTPSTETENKTELPQVPPAGGDDDGLYLPVLSDSNLKFKIDGKFEDYRETQFDQYEEEHLKTNPYYNRENEPPWFQIPTGSIFKMADGTFVYVAYGPVTIKDTDSERDLVANNNQSLLILNGTFYNASSLFIDASYGNYQAGFSFTVGTIIYDDLFGTDSYYIYTNTGSKDIAQGSNINWLKYSMQNYSGGTDPWNRLNFYTSP